MNPIYCAITGVQLSSLESFAVSVPLDSDIKPVDLASLEAIVEWAQQQIELRGRVLN